jgi:hypothetical protein
MALDGRASWCNPCTKATVDFVNQMLKPTKLSPVFSTTFTIDLSPTAVLQCPFCNLLRQSIARKIVDFNDLMDVRLRYTRTDPVSNLIFIENTASLYQFELDRGSIKLFAQHSSFPHFLAHKSDEESAGYLLMCYRHTCSSSHTRPKSW